MSANLLLFILLLSLVLGIIWFFRREQRSLNNLISFAERRGWEAHAHPEKKRVYQIRHQSDELGWEMDIFRVADRQIPLTQWSCRHAAIKGSPVVIGPQNAGMVYEPETQKMVHQMTKQLIFDAPGNKLTKAAIPPGWERMGVSTEGLGPQRVGTPAFQEMFTVLSRSMYSARQVLHPEVERKLRDWPPHMSFIEGPLIQVDEDGVLIRVQNDRAFWKTEVLAYIVDLGEEIGRAVRASV